jgi:hypothetical protein
VITDANESTRDEYLDNGFFSSSSLRASLIPEAIWNPHLPAMIEHSQFMVFGLVSNRLNELPPLWIPDQVRDGEKEEPPRLLEGSLSSQGNGPGGLF